MSYAKRLVQGFVWLAGATVLSNVFSYALRLYLARTLTVAEYGLVYSIFAFMGILGLFSHLGLFEALVREITHGNVSGKLGRIKTAIRFVLRAQTISMCILLLLLLAFAGSLENVYFRYPGAGMLLIIYALANVFGPLEVLLITLTQSYQRMDLYSWLLVFRPLMLLVITFLFLHFGFGVTGVMLSYLLVYVFILALFWPLLFRMLLPWYKTTKPVPYRQVSMPMLRYGLPVIATAAASSLITYTDTVTLTWFRSLEEVGLYNTALPISNILWLLANMFFVLLFPAIAEMHKRKQLGLLKEGMSRIYLYVFLGITPVILVGMLYAPEVLNLLFGGQYLAAAPALRVLFIASFFYSFAAINNAFLSGVGKPVFTTKAVITAGVINLVVNLMLVPKFGMIGSAVGTLISLVCMLAISTTYVRRIVPFVLPTRGVVTGVCCALVFLLVEVLCKEYLPLQNWTKLLIGAVGGGLLYVGLLLVTKTLSREDINLFLRR